MPLVNGVEDPAWADAVHSCIDLEVGLTFQNLNQLPVRLETSGNNYVLAGYLCSLTVAVIDGYSLILNAYQPLPGID